MDNKTNEGTRTASELIETTDGGVFNAEASNELRELVKALEESVRLTGKAKGSLSMRFDFAAESSGKCKITAEVTSKRPKAPRSESMAWLNGDALAEADPRQARLPLAGIAREGKPLAGAK